MRYRSRIAIGALAALRLLLLAVAMKAPRPLCPEGSVKSLFTACAVGIMSR
jgi:hypothetical protein